MPNVPVRSAAAGQRCGSYDRGFSLVELVIVCAIFAILVGISVLTLTPHERATAADDLAKQTLEFVQDASSRALAQRQTMRLTIDLGASTISVTDENTLLAGVDDDELVREEGLVRPEFAVIGQPAGVDPPADPFHFEPAGFEGGVWQAWFRSDGSVVNADGVPLSATIFVYPTDAGRPGYALDNGLVRALTLFGPSGQYRLWRYTGTEFVAR
jgi:prepilin-type N-terminal cleavage/methylation domain-containing protein